MIKNPFKKEPTLAELEEETERLEVQDDSLGTQLSIAQKRVAIAQLKQRGLTARHFGNVSLSSTWNRIIQWLRSH